MANEYGRDDDGASEIVESEQGGAHQAQAVSVNTHTIRCGGTKHVRTEQGVRYGPHRGGAPQPMAQRH